MNNNVMNNYSGGQRNERNRTGTGYYISYIVGVWLEEYEGQKSVLEQCFLYTFEVYSCIYLLTVRVASYF